MVQITAASGVTRTATRGLGSCQHALLGGDGLPLVRAGRTLRCDQPAVSLAVDLAAVGRDVLTVCRCERHGGERRASDLLAAVWQVAAPDSVGGTVAVLDAGALALTTREAYVVVRPEGARWLAWIGIGSAMAQVANPQGGKLDALGRPATRLRRGKRVQRGTSAFATREDATAHAIEAWRSNLAERVAEITRTRGGTLAWGLPVEPLREPVVLVLPEHGSAWDVALRTERRGAEGIAFAKGLRNTGEIV